MQFAAPSRTAAKRTGRKKRVWGRAQRWFCVESDLFLTFKVDLSTVFLKELELGSIPQRVARGQRASRQAIARQERRKNRTAAAWFFQGFGVHSARLRALLRGPEAAGRRHYSGLPARRYNAHRRSLMDILVLSLVAGLVVGVGIWLATRDTRPPEGS